MERLDNLDNLDSSSHLISHMEINSTSRTRLSSRTSLRLKPKLK